MAHVYFDRIRETSVTTGTGDFQLAGAVSGYRAFSAVMADGDTTDIEISMGSAMESVKIRYNSGTNTLTRQYIHESSNSGALVSFGAGTKDVFITLSAKVAQRAEVERRINALLDLIYQSKLFAAPRRVVKTAADGLMSSAGIDGSSTNYTVTSTSAAISYVAPSATSGLFSGTSAYKAGYSGTSLATVLDDNTGGTTTTISGFGNQSGQTLSQRVFVSQDLGSNQSVISVTLKAFGMNGGNSGISITYSTDNTNWTLLGTTFNYASGSADVTKTASVTARYIGIALDAVNNTGVTATLTDINANAAAGVNNMTLLTTAQTADATVSSGRVLIEFDNTATPTLNTDLIVEVTCNGGTNWTAASLSSTGIGQSGRLVVETVDQATTGGTSFAARIKTFNNKNVPIYGVSVTVH